MNRLNIAPSGINNNGGGNTTFEQFSLQQFMDGGNGNNNSMHQQQHQHSHNNNSSNGSHFVFGGGSSQATSTLQPLPHSSTMVVNTLPSSTSQIGQQQHNHSSSSSNNAQNSSTTSIQMQFQQQLQQYQQRLLANNNQQQQLPSMNTQNNNNTYQQVPAQEEDQLIDWINDGSSSRLLQQQELPPFEDFEFGWFGQAEENIQAANIMLNQQLTNGGYFNNGMGQINEMNQEMDNNYQARQMMGLNSNYASMNNMNGGGMVQPGQQFVLSDDPNMVAAWSMNDTAADLELEKPPSPLLLDGLMNKHSSGNGLFGGSQLYTNHTISTTESKNMTSITALANSLTFTESPPTKKGKRSKRNVQASEQTMQNNNIEQQCQYQEDVANDQFDNQGILEMDEETFRSHILAIFGEKSKRNKSKGQLFDEEDFSKLLITRARITELYQQCQTENMNLVNSIMSQYTPSIDIRSSIDDAMNNEMKELYSKVNSKLGMKNNENRRHCEQVLGRLISEWISVVKTQKPSAPTSDMSSNNSSNNSKKKSRSTNRRLPNEAKKILENWFLEHYKHPYPTNEEKQWLSDQTQLNLTQINNWFINKRGRSLKIVKEKLRTEQSTTQSDDGEE